MRRGHLGVAVDPLVPETFLLDGAGLGDAFPDGGGGFRRTLVGDLLPLQGRHLDVKVDAIEQWPRDAADVFLDLVRGAEALPRGIGVVAAGAWVCCLSAK